MRRAARAPSSVAVGGHPDVDDGQVRVRRRHGGLERRGVARRGDHLVAGVLEQPRPAPRGTGRSPRRSRCARQHRLDRACRARGAARRAARRPRAATRSASPASPEPGASVAPPRPSSRDPDLQPARRRAATCSAMRVGVGVLDGVGHRLARDVVGGRRDVVGQRLGVDVQLDRQRDGCGQVDAAPGRGRRRGCSAAARARSGAARRRRCRARRRPGRAARSTSTVPSPRWRWASRSAMPSETSRCWAPSCRSRSSRRRSS